MKNTTEAKRWGHVFRAFEAGLWLFLPMDNECLWMPKPLVHRANGRLHNEAGPAIAMLEEHWFYWNGIAVDEYVVMEPQKITVADIEKESNAEVRRVKIERYGQSNYLIDSGAKEIHKDDFGTLYHKDIPSDEPLVMVLVLNATPEPNGSFKNYYLRVHPECRPLLDNNQLGNPQPLTARNAVASTFGKRGEEYAPCLET